jgi:hypothetical protein
MPPARLKALKEHYGDWWPLNQPQSIWKATTEGVSLRLELEFFLSNGRQTFFCNTYIMHGSKAEEKNRHLAVDIKKTLFAQCTWVESRTKSPR